MKSAEVALLYILVVTCLWTTYSKVSIKAFIDNIKYFRKFQAFLVSKIFTIKYEANETYLADTKYDLISVDRYHSYTDFETRLIKPISNLSVHFQLYTCYNDCHPYLLNVTFDLCSADGKSGNYYVNSIFRTASSTLTNLLPTKCPFKEGVYYMRNASINLNMFRLFPIPDNTYQIFYSAHITDRKLRIFLFSAKYKFRLYNVDERKPIRKKEHL